MEKYVPAGALNGMFLEGMKQKLPLKRVNVV